MSAAHDNPHAWSLHASLERASASSTLRVRGRIGSAGAGELKAALHDAVVPGVRLLLDMDAVDYLSSAGIEVLRDAARRVRDEGGCLELTRASEAVKMALHLAGPIPH